MSQKKTNTLKLIDKIQDIRSKNNGSWMDILKVAFKHDPLSASKIMSNIYMDDQKISKLVKKLVIESKKK
jgi:hypothetical protein